MNRYLLSLALGSLMLFGACQDAWEDHLRVSDDVAQQSLAQYIGSKGEFSEFYSLLVATSLDKALAEQSIKTIWVPTNAAMQSVPNDLIANEAALKRFVMNHISSGAYSAKNPSSNDSIYMMSGKKLLYQPEKGLIDDVPIKVESEKRLTNGFLQVVDAPILPRATIWDWVITEAEDNKFINYLKSLDFIYFDAEASSFLGYDDKGNAVYRDSVTYIRNQFLMQVADLDSEDSLLTLLIPTDEVFESHFTQFNRYFRLDDRESNVIPTVRDSAQIWMNVARDFVFNSAFDKAEAPDTLVSFFKVKVPFIRTAVSKSERLSNGYIHFISEAPVKTEHKILPVMMNAEECAAIFTGTNSFYYPFYSVTGGGIDGLYLRKRANTYGGYDVIQDNQASSGIHAGLVLAGPLLSSTKYRVKLRASNDFKTSPRWEDETKILRQCVAPVSVLRNNVTKEFTGLSPNNNKLRSTGGFGNADVVYDTSDEASYYIPVTTEPYSENMLGDEIDLGYYDYRYMEYAFFRIIPYAAQMAVVVDYLRLVPVIE